MSLTQMHLKLSLKLLSHDNYLGRTKGRTSALSNVRQDNVEI